MSVETTLPWMPIFFTNNVPGVISNCSQINIILGPFTKYGAHQLVRLKF